MMGIALALSGLAFMIIIIKLHIKITELSFDESMSLNAEGDHKSDNAISNVTYCDFWYRGFLNDCEKFLELSYNVDQRLLKGEDTTKDGVMVSMERDRLLSKVRSQTRVSNN